MKFTWVSTSIPYKYVDIYTLNRDSNYIMLSTYQEQAEKHSLHEIHFVDLAKR